MEDYKPTTVTRDRFDGCRHIVVSLSRRIVRNLWCLKPPKLTRNVRKKLKLIRDIFEANGPFILSGEVHPYL